MGAIVKGRYTKVLVELLIKMIRVSATPIDRFDATTWFHIRDEFNASTGLNFNAKQLSHRVVDLYEEQHLKPTRDELLVSLLIKTIRLANAPIEALDAATWSRILDEFNASTGLRYDLDRLSVKLLHLYSRYTLLEKELRRIQVRPRRKPWKCLWIHLLLFTIFRSPEFATTNSEFISKTTRKPLPAGSFPEMRTSLFSFTDFARELNKRGHVI